MTYAELKTEHCKKWDEIWDISEINIDGDEEAEYALNYSIYHLNCIAPRNMKAKSIPARGLSGQVYKGAVFWDTEMFMIDYYIHTEPQIAKTLLEYRIDTLNGARNKAKEYNLDGAYYAWESQEGGYEGCSDYNVTDVFTNRPMGIRHRMKNGTFKQGCLPYGYYLGENDEWIINEEQAKIVRIIFNAYIGGMSLGKIANELKQAGVPKGNGSIEWEENRVRYIPNLTSI